MSNDIYSFYKLISEYKIVIPVIQRSYAEGRNTKHSEDVRKSIVESMIKSAMKQEPLFLDFVYGNISEDKNSNIKIFIPFDGQQRLTTLFLFHIYVFEKVKESKKILKKFSYETRASAKEFIEKICDNRVIPSDEKKLSEYLTNQNWFFSDWQKDPTVSSMLVVLDEIHNQFQKLKDVNFAEILNQLKIGCITFHFVDMQKNNLPNQTYIKMNARGKTLTAFENFKASLEEYLEEKDKNLYENFKSNIDTNWVDLFYEQSKPELPDAMIMSFFNWHFLNVWNLCKGNDNSENDKDFEKISGLNLNPKIDEFASWDIYKTILDNTSFEKSLKPIFNILKNLCENKNSILRNIKPYKICENWNLFKRENATYPSRVAFYAVLTYFEQDVFDEKSFSHWMRIIWNVVENATIDNFKNYLYALRFVDEISSYSHSIYEFLANPKEKIYSDFASEQVKEERLKAKKILESESWKEKILESERYEILLGKISVLFPKDENTTEAEFENRFNLLKKINENADKFHLVKVLVSYYEKEIPAKKIYLGNTKENLKELVTNVFASEFRKITEDKINHEIKYDWIRELSETNLLNASRGQYLKKYGNRVVLYGTQGCIWVSWGNNVWGNVILGETKRNQLLKSLSNAEFETYYNGKDYLFFSGWETYFKFENNFFVWRPHDDPKTCDVYLMEKDWRNYKKRKTPLSNKTNTEADEYFAFNATDEMLKNTKLFSDGLKNLISESEK